MIAILKQSASNEAVSHIVSWIEKKRLKTDVSRGENETIIGLVGDTTKIDPFLLESMDVVERVQRVSEPFKRANRKFHPEDSVIDCGHGVKIGGDQFQVIAGPCSVEGENLIRIARRVKAAGATMLRGGAYKPRTSPYAYQGMGPAGLDLLCEASAELDMPIVTEIMDPRDVQVFLDKKIDVMQIGARNAQNFPLLKEVGKTKTPILLKRGMSGTVDELLMAAEYIMSEGNDNVILCERGIRTFETRTRNTFDLNAVPVLHHMGIAEPKIAILAANEKPSPKMPATMDAKALCEMAASGELPAGIYEGPIAFDVAMRPEAAAEKGITSRVSGDVDLFLVPNIETGNCLGKAIGYFGHCQTAGIVVGAAAPVVMSSRAASIEGKVTSIAWAILACGDEQTEERS